MTRCKGFTLLELMLVVAIAAILASLAIPSFQDMLEKRRAAGAAQHVYEQLALARMEAVKRSKKIYVSFETDNATTWSFGVTDNATGRGCYPTLTDVTAAGACKIDYDNDNGTYSGSGTDDPYLTRFDSNELGGHVEMKIPNFSGQTTVFTPLRGLDSAAGTVRLTTDNYEVRVVVSSLGRVRICTEPVDDKTVPGYPEC